MNISPEVQQRLWATAGVTKISDIPGFPLPNHSALKASVVSGKVQLGIEYKAARDLANITKSKGAYALLLALAWVTPALVVSSIIVAFVTGNWWALGGVVSSFLGWLFANPYNPAKRLGQVLVVAALLYVVYAQSIVQGVAWVCFSFAASDMSLWILNRLAWTWASEAALTSEAFAAYLFKTHNLHIRDSQGTEHNARAEG